MSKIKFAYFTIADYEDEEIWLRKQHQNGLKFKQFIIPGIYIFDECEKEDVIYRLDYNEAPRNEDYTKLFEDYGWEYLMTFNGFSYFRKPKSKIEADIDGEIFSDNVTKVEMVEHIIKTKMIPVSILLISSLIILIFISDYELLEPWFKIIHASIVLLDVTLLTHCTIKLNKLKNKYLK